MFFIFKFSMHIHIHIFHETYLTSISRGVGADRALGSHAEGYKCSNFCRDSPKLLKLSC